MPEREIRHFLVQGAAVTWIRGVAYVTAKESALSAQQLECPSCKQWAWALLFCGHCGKALPYS